MAKTPEKMKQSLLEVIADCHERIATGDVDVGVVENNVREYCTMIASMPPKEGLKYAEDLQTVMDSVTALGKALIAAREATRMQLEELEKIKKAHDAYQKSGKK